jgi:catechol 2,3-dioxygenase
VRLQVRDLASSIDYYGQVVGLSLLSHVAPDAILGEPTDSTPLVVLHEHPSAQPVPRHGRLGLYHFALLLPDRGSLGRFLAHLATSARTRPPPTTP